MPIGEPSGLPASPIESSGSASQQTEATKASEEISSGQQRAAKQRGSAEDTAKRSNPLADHKGKLAIGAAAMLGLAVFYKWRDNKLAKEDPEEYERLRRLKAAVGTDESKPKKER